MHGGKADSTLSSGSHGGEAYGITFKPYITEGRLTVSLLSPTCTERKLTASLQALAVVVGKLTASLQALAGAGAYADCRCRTGSYREPLAPLHRSPEQVVGALQIHLLLDSSPVGLHGFDGDVELFCNLTGGLSFSGQFEHLQLPVAEKFERIIRVGSPVAGQLHQQFVSEDRKSTRLNSSHV